MLLTNATIGQRTVNDSKDDDTSILECEKPTSDTGMRPVAKRFTKVTAVYSVLGFWIDYSEGNKAEVVFASAENNQP